MQEPSASTTSQPAVTATRPASEALSDIETSGLPFLIQVKIIVTQVAIAGAQVVVTNIEASCGPLFAAAPLKPYQPNQRMNTPSAPRVKECPGIALATFLPVFLSSTYLPIRGPTIIAPINAVIPPTI